MTAVKTMFLCVAVVLFVPLARSQGQGVVDGRIVNGTRPASAPTGVQVDVVQPMGGMSVLKSQTVPASGKFHFDGLPTDGPLLIRAEYKTVNYYSPVTFDAAGKAEMEIQVFEPTASAQGIRLESLRIAFQLSSDGLRSLESFSFNNQSKPPQSFTREEGSFRFSKAPGISQPPRLDVTGPGSNMPVTQSPLESADGQSYYSLYPLRPGVTTFEVAQVLPYENRSYTFRQKFYEDVGSLSVGVIPQDMNVSGEGLTKVQSDSSRNFAVYSTGPIKAGAEVVWTFSGGTPVAEAPADAPADPAQSARVVPMPTLVGRNALIIGPLMLLGLIMVLWFAHNRIAAGSAAGQDARIQGLKERREQLLDYVAALDVRYEKEDLPRPEYLRLREQSKRHLRRIAMLLAKK